MAVTGSASRKVLHESEEAMAISASCSAVGSGMVAQSAKIKLPSTPHELSSRAITKQEEAYFVPGLVLIIVIAARSTVAVAFSAPATIASAIPFRTIIAAQFKGST